MWSNWTNSATCQGCNGTGGSGVQLIVRTCINYTAANNCTELCPTSGGVLSQQPDGTVTETNTTDCTCPTSKCTLLKFRKFRSATTIRISQGYKLIQIVVSYMNCCHLRYFIQNM